MYGVCCVNLSWSATARLRKVSLQLPHLSAFFLIKRVFIPIPKILVDKDDEQKYCMSRRTTKAYCRMVRRTTTTYGIYAIRFVCCCFREWYKTRLPIDSGSLLIINTLYWCQVQRNTNPCRSDFCAFCCKNQRNFRLTTVKIKLLKPLEKYYEIWYYI